MNDIAKEIEKLANKYRAERKTQIEDVKNSQNNFEIDDFLLDDTNSTSDFDENYLADLESEISQEFEQEIKISEFINPKNSEENNSKNLLNENNLKPKNHAMSLMRNVSKNLRDLKVLMRS